MSAGAVPRTDRIAGVGPIALLTRGLGILLWGMARPESLPVPEPGAEPGSASVAPPGRGGAFPRTAATGLTLLALAVLCVGIIASLGARRAVSEFARTAPGTPLSETADRLAGSLEGSWWVVLYPTLPGRLDHAATQLRAGEADLKSLATIYLRERDALNRRGLPARLLAGATEVAAVNSAILAPQTPWHRGTLVYTEVAEALRPYREAGEETSDKVVATLSQTPPDHALVVTVNGADGERLVTTPPLVLGEAFTLPIVTGARVTLTSLVRPADGGAYRVEAGSTLLIEEWPREALNVPGSGQFQFHFDADSARRAPPLPDLTRAARAEIGLAVVEGGR
jgi:hypothetical protein